MFYSYHSFIKSDFCAFNPYFYIELGVAEYYLCTLYIITVDDLWEYSPFSASDLEIYALCPICPRVMNGVDPLYKGKFIKLGDQAYPNEPVDSSTTQTGSLRVAAYRDLQITGGKQMGGYIMHSGCTARGDPGGGKWAYDLPTMLQLKDRERIIEELNQQKLKTSEHFPLKLNPYDMGDNMFRAWEIANRHRDGSLPQTVSDNDLGTLIYHYRPHPVFQRYKYNITGFERPCGEQTGGVCKYNRMGEPCTYLFGILFACCYHTLFFLSFSLSLFLSFSHSPFLNILCLIPFFSSFSSFILPFTLHLHPTDKLTAVTMPPWNEECYQTRINRTNHCLPENNETTTADVNIDNYAEGVKGPCGYRIDNVFKLFVGNLRENSPEGTHIIFTYHISKHFKTFYIHIFKTFFYSQFQNN
jgi:hypothetical protein